MVFRVGGSNGIICGSIKSKMVAGGHLGMKVLTRITLASAGFLVYLVIAFQLVMPLDGEMWMVWWLSGNSLNGLSRLETLELSGNHIYSIKVTPVCTLRLLCNRQTGPFFWSQSRLIQSPKVNASWWARNTVMANGLPCTQHCCCDNDGVTDCRQHTAIMLSCWPRNTVVVPFLSLNKQSQDRVVQWNVRGLIHK